MDQINRTAKSDYATYITRALATEGGHLAVGRGGATLYFSPGVSLSSYDIEPIKDACIAAGLPVIDSSMVDFGVVAWLAINGPMVAVGVPPDTPPYHAFSRAPLAVVAEAYRVAGAMVWNLGRIRATAGAREGEA
jgi:hypothetical protein